MYCLTWVSCGAAQAPGGAWQRGTGGGRATPKLHPEVKLLREGVDVSQRIVYEKCMLMSDCYLYFIHRWLVVFSPEIHSIFASPTVFCALFFSVAGPGCLSRILIFHPGSRIDPH